MRTFIMFIIAAALCWASGAHACIWDSDTLSSEAAVMDVAGVIVGRFARNPPLYYEMRLERVRGELQKSPARLELYDDAGVAADRLGRHDEAIEWMARKAAVLDAMDADDAQVREHRYRYLANLGTFHAHRWIALGADRSDMADMRRGRELIAAAIGLNPDAHFGRERYQLMAMEWILDPPAVANGEGRWLLPPLTATSAPELTTRLTQWVRMSPPKDDEWREMIEAMSGLVVLGSAWQSVDVYHTLSLALQAEGHSSLALLANLRARELINQGGESLHPDAPHGEALKAALVHHDPLVSNVPKVEKSFRRQRRAAEALHQARERFMLQRLKAGMHPDTHPNFWQGFKDFELSRGGSSTYNRSKVMAAVPLALGVGLLLHRRRQARRA